MSTSTDAEIVSSLDRSHNGHELDEVRAFVPGAEPTDASVALSDGPTYETTYWRCRHCDEERTHWSGFVDRCASERASTPDIDGGFDPFDVPERVLKRAQYESLAFSWLDGDVRVRNERAPPPIRYTVSGSVSWSAMCLNSASMYSRPNVGLIRAPRTRRPGRRIQTTRATSRRRFHPPFRGTVIARQPFPRGRTFRP